MISTTLKSTTCKLVYRTRSQPYMQVAAMAHKSKVLPRPYYFLNVLLRCLAVKEGTLAPRHKQDNHQPHASILAKGLCCRLLTAACPTAPGDVTAGPLQDQETAAVCKHAKHYGSRHCSLADTHTLQPLAPSNTQLGTGHWWINRKT